MCNLIFNNIHRRFLGVCFLSLLLVGGVFAQKDTKDTLLIPEAEPETYDQFYDSLKIKSGNSKLGKLLFDFLVTSPRPYVDKKALAIDYYSKVEGKIIADIEIKALDVFGPNFNDTSRIAKSWVERTANKIHTKSNLRTIEKMLMFKIGDRVEPEKLYENERIIRALPYIKDIRFIIQQDSVYTGLVKVFVITQDRFSLGVTGDVSSSSSAVLEMYNQNIFGIGHEISLRFVGHLDRQPYMGLETFYKINNVRGKFIDFSAGYMNTYNREGYSFILNKPFLTTSMKWGYGISALRMFRTDRINDEHPIITTSPMSLWFFNGWAGRSFQLKRNGFQNSQMILSAGFYNRNFYERPRPSPTDNQYFSNGTFYLTSIAFSQRRFIKDQLVYSYGIVEDIPEGFKNEIVYGFDANEFGDRHYAHLFLSNGNLLINRKGYLYMAGAIGGYYTNQKYQQGQIQGSLSFISRQIKAGPRRLRLFVRSNYLLGINRFEIENLDLRKENHIRGFTSRKALGKQRLSVDLEYVLFLHKELYKFKTAIYGFADIGIIGSNKELIFTQNYYSGLGFGVRVHNENLLFKTIQLRLAFYPFPPDDMSFVGFILEEQSKKSYYSFEPTPPLPLSFE